MLFLLRTGLVLSYFINNLGWLHLTYTAAPISQKEAEVAKAMMWFQKAASINTGQHQAFWGMGMADALIGHEATAISSWEKAGVEPDILVRMGNNLLTSDQHDEALIYYKGANQLSLTQPNEAVFLAANVCQESFGQLTKLNQLNQIYCQQYFANNEKNLIVNGQFVLNTLSGWRERYFQSPKFATYFVDETVGDPPNAATLVGLTEGYHGGIFQIISLPPGTRIRYSAWFKIQTDSEVNVRLLYLGGRQNDEPFGNALDAITENMGWSYLERTVSLPKADESIYMFFPALLTGKGKVWFDNVRLEILSDQN